MIAGTRFCIWRGCVVCALLTGPVFAQSAPEDDAVRNPSPDLRDILHEQSDLRRELQDLEEATQQVKHRLKRLGRLADVQRELDRLIQKLEQAESSDDEAQAARMESRIEPLERQLDDLREGLEIEGELNERIAAVQEIMQGIRETEGIDEAPRWAQHLAKTMDAFGKLRDIRGKLNTLGPGVPESLRDKLAKQADDLQERIDADDELVELIARVLEAFQDEEEEEFEDLLPEVSELLDELANQNDQQSNLAGQPVAMSELASGEYFVTQSWTQERKSRRPYYVRVPNSEQPQGTDRRKLPVFIFLHGNGGNAQEAMRGFMRNRKQMASRYVMVFAQGYRESWNIVSERSKADDRGFIEAIVLKLATYSNVDGNNFTIMGESNGAALVNQLMIESKLPNIRSYISGVSPLNVWQYDGTHFKAKGDDNNYRVVATPMTGKRLMNISGTDDQLVPYRGGPSQHIPAKDGKLAFVDAEESTFLWARQMGFQGERLAEPAKTDGNLEIFSYLDGDVIHCKVIDAGHGATHEISEEMLMDFMQSGESESQK